MCDNGDIAVLNHNPAVGVSAWSRYSTCGKFISVAVSDNKTYVLVQRENDICLEYFDKNVLNDAGEHNFICLASGVPEFASGHTPRYIKLRRITVRVLNTKSIYINDKPVALPNEIYDTTSLGFSGDVSMNFLGTQTDCSYPIWTIKTTSSYPITVLSVGINGWYMV